MAKTWFQNKVALLNVEFLKKPILISIGLAYSFALGVWIISGALDHSKTMHTGTKTTALIVKKYKNKSRGRRIGSLLYIRYRFESPDIYSNTDESGDGVLRVVEDEQKISRKFYNSISQGNRINVYYRFDDFELKSAIGPTQFPTTINILFGGLFLFPSFILFIIYGGAAFQIMREKYTRSA